ncbi:MAG: UDP-N-acetylmuramoyl-tripeptide--D-alanyl-D-alanine ligase [Candidatus Daviesbacteria bacterium]|nr:UDP-N-acetylmuramoyl-tripeptide--D-alanyl-D-alanine ligase [Candidatus Daviesbacteria bacterium]
MDIAKHPIWDQVTPYKTKISAFKKPFHLFRIYLAKQYARLYKPETFIGVTGSVGKTTCVEVAKAVLSQKYKTISTKPNLDPVLNIPSTILRMNPAIQKVILEMGVEYKNEMDFYLSLVKPKIVVITKIAYAHSEYLGGIDGILEEKGKLVASLTPDGVAILNYDDPNCRKLAENCDGTVFYYGMDSKNCTVWAGNPKIENFATTFELNLGVERVKVNFQLLGLHQVYSALAGALLGVVSGIPLTKIKLALESIKPSEHRLQAVQGPGNSILLDDTYNCSPSALEASIDALLAVPARRRIVVLGEMRELGPYSEKLHRAVAQKIYKEKLDFVFLGQGDTEFIADELKSLGFREDRLESNLGNSDLVSKLLRILEKGDVCLIKGSRAVRLDEVVRRIAKKT